MWIATMEARVQSRVVKNGQKSLGQFYIYVLCVSLQVVITPTLRTHHLSSVAGVVAHLRPRY
jgi:hypothetical protein